MTAWFIGIGIYLFIGLIYGLFDLFQGMTALPMSAWGRTYFKPITFLLLVIYMFLWFPNAAHIIYYKITGENHDI